MALYLGKKRVAPSIQVKVPSMKAYFEAGGRFNSKTATSFEGVCNYGDTSNVTNMDFMFSNCDKLYRIPLLDTSNVISMYGMFWFCSNLLTIPQLDTSNVTNMNSMFYRCNHLTTIPLLDTSKVTNMKSMFDECSDLTSIPAFNVQNVTNMEGIFNNCFAITEIHMYGMKVSFQINDYRSKFTREALVEILNNLATVTSTQTFTMGSTNLAKLTDEDKAIATGKGWTLA